MFQPVKNNVSFPQLEEETIEFWRGAGVYQQSLDARRGSPPFVFYEGPPTANGMPHPGHCLTRAIKDLFPRYKTMRGYYCERKGGWDTHGLPVEVEVCKELGIHSKEEIENYGVEPFIQLCQQSVWRYMQEWERLTERLGFWIHLEDAYVTYHQSYVESVWWSLKNLFDRGLLYQGHKIVWWWAQGGTALSSGEVGLGYREVADPSVYVRFPLLDDEGKGTDTSLLVWTTTPWTLPSNQFAAVHPELEYSVLSTEYSVGGGNAVPHKIVVASALVEQIRAKSKQELPEVGDRLKGVDLLGKRYVPPFDYYYAAQCNEQGELRAGGQQRKAWRVVAADFVTTDSGTGVVHQAPAFGEVDYDVLIAEQAHFADNEGPELINAVGPDGKFTSEAPDWEGRWVKEADKDIAANLKERGLLFLHDQYLHEYPFCWRADQDPLIQYPRRSWFIRTTKYKDQMLANNARINWLPEHIRDGRFGNFLESNVDWALSRERYWGTPLPIWICQETGQMEAVANYDELLAKPGVDGAQSWEQAKAANPELPDDLKVHKPYIDDVTYDSPFADGARMRRVTEVIDCWYDSGAMPFAQWGYPQQNHEQFDQQFPADFISEALDQTRGWFYSQLAISTLMFGEQQEAEPLTPTLSHREREKSEIPNPKSEIPYPHPFRNCIVLGLMLAEGYVCAKCQHRHQESVKKCEKCGSKVERRVEKMAKRLRNYSEPQEIFDKYGADALRWYFFANQAPWTSLIYSERAIKESIPRFLLTLWNCYSFLVTYANTDDKFDPAERIDGDVGQLTSADLARGEGYRPISERRELDRWLMSELNRLCAAVVEKMDAYDNFGACKLIDSFVDNLSNWYVRRSRSRFWSQEYESTDKLDAYWTLYECLVTTAKLIAPFTPFIAEAMWRNLAGVFGDRASASVHLCDYPTGDAAAIDETLSEQMELGRTISSLGQQARATANIKVRQPLEKVEVILADTQHEGWLRSHSDVIAEELNVEQVEFPTDPDKYIDHQVVPNFKVLGPKLGKNMPKVKKWLGQQSGADLLANVRDNGQIDIDLDGESVVLTQEDVEVRIAAKEGWTAGYKDGSGVVVVLSTEITPQLVRRGIARTLVRLINDRRKELNCEFTDRISVGLVTDDANVQQAIEENRDYIMQETLADDLQLGPLEGVDPVEVSVEGAQANLYVKVL